LEALSDASRRFPRESCKKPPLAAPDAAVRRVGPAKRHARSTRHREAISSGGGVTAVASARARDAMHAAEWRFEAW
jgi:hypothetical protein